MVYRGFGVVLVLPPFLLADPTLLTNYSSSCPSFDMPERELLLLHLQVAKMAH